MRSFDRRIVAVVRSAVALLLLAAVPASAQTAQRLADFNETTPYGFNPLTLVEHPNGLLYGIAGGGGTFSSGTLFSMTLSGTVTLLHAFAGAPGDAKTPLQLILGQDGNLYGISRQGGANDCGAIFTATPAGVTSLVASFSCGDIGNPPALFSRLIGGTNGRAYVSTFSGPFGKGSFYYVTAGAAPTTLFDYPDYPSVYSSVCGAPQSATAVVDGLFYGSDGSNVAGSCVFSMTLDGALVPLAHLPYTGPLALGRDGFVYGTRRTGSCGQVPGLCYQQSSIVSRVAPTGGAQDVVSVAGWLAWLVQLADGSFVGLSRTNFNLCPGPHQGNEPQLPCTPFPGTEQLQRFSAAGSAYFAVDFTPTSAFVSASNGLLYVFGYRSGDGESRSAFSLLPPTSVPEMTVNGSATSPEGMAAGTPSSWTATNTLLTTDVEYKFWVLSDIGWRVVQDYSSDPVLRWSPAHAGQYLVQTWIRTQGSTAAWEGYQSTSSFNVAAPAAVSLADVHASPSLPITTGAVTTFSAAATGGVGPLQ